MGNTVIADSIAWKVEKLMWTLCTYIWTISSKEFANEEGNPFGKFPCPKAGEFDSEYDSYTWAYGYFRPVDI